MNIPQTARHFGYDPGSLARTALRHAERISALGRARKHRREYFDLEAAIKADPYRAAFRLWLHPAGDEAIDAYEARDLAREMWRESLWEMSR